METLHALVGFLLALLREALLIVVRQRVEEFASKRKNTEVPEAPPKPQKRAGKRNVRIGARIDDWRGS